MAMAMIQKTRPLVPMQEKPTTASPDFDTFQLLFRKADEITDDSDRNPTNSSNKICENLNETDGIIEGGTNKKPFTHQPNESQLFHTLPTRTIIFPKTYPDEIRRIRIRTKRTRNYNINFLPTQPYENWESKIIWDDNSLDVITRGKGGWVYQHQEDDETVSKKLRKVMSCQNSEILSGRWVDGILWDHDTTYTVDLFSDSEGVADDDISDTDGSNDDQFSSLQAPSKRKRDETEFCDYSENIPLVNTAEIIDIYLPHHQEENRKAELKRKQEEEEEGRRRLTMLSLTSLSTPIQSQPTASTTAPTNASTSTTAAVTVPLDPQAKSALLRQQQAKDKAERLAKLESSKTPALNASSSTTVQSNLDDPNAGQSGTRKKKLTASTELEHSTLASRHLTCKVSLTPNELKYYRRPLGRGMQNVWNISFDSKKNKNKVSHKRGHVRQHLVNQIRTLSDLALLEGDFICIEYIEEHPNILMNPGMASKIINYYRQVPEDKNQTLQSTTEDSIVQEGQSLSTTITKATKRIPRHLLHLQQNSMSSNTSTGLDTIDIPKLSEGVTEVLESGDPFPFMGDIEPGAPPQPCLHSNLFRAPLFNQTIKTTDFLLIRNPQNRKSMHFILRSLPTMFTCGQQEPLVVVPKPGKKKSLNPFQQNFLMLHMTRYFLNQGGSNVEAVVSLSDVQREFEYFFKRYRNDAKRCLGRVAEDIGEDLWKRKSLNQIHPVEEYETKFTPEDVCLHERSMCSEYQLQQLGINQLVDVSKMQQGIQRMNWLQNSRKKRLESIRESASLCSGTSKSLRLDRLADILEYHYKKLKNEIEVARFIYERMQLTPWVITDSFVKGYLEKGGDGMLRLLGLGDPSGIGEGFSLLRNIKSSGKQNDINIYNTDRDLRKNSKKQLDEMLAPHYTPEQLKSIHRWDKVALLRRLANIAHDKGVAHDLHRFARSKKPSQQNLLSDFRQACQNIWEKQATALSIKWKDVRTPSSENGDDDDDDDEYDDDDFENEFNDLDEGIAPSGSNAPGIVNNPSSSGSGRGRKKEEEENKELKSLKTGEFFESFPSAPTAPSSTTSQLQQSEFLVSNKGIQWEPPKQVVKRITRKIKPDGSETIEVRFIVSDVEVSRVQAKKEGNQSAAKKKNPLQPLPHEMEDVFEDEKSDAHSLKLNLGKMKHKAQKHARESAQMRALQELEEQRELDRYNMPLRTQKDRANANRGKVTRNNRLPHVLFASTLEEILVGIIKRKNSLPFLHPVDTNAFPDYFSIIQRPICLFDIRENIAKYKYSTIDLFLEDLSLMVRNCEQYNSPSHYYSKEAQQIYSETLELINVDRDILGYDKDPYTIQQNDIRTKFHQLKRPLHSTMIPNLMPTSAPPSTYIPTSNPPVISNQPVTTTATTTTTATMYDGFGQFFDPNNDDYLDDFKVNFDETEAIPPVSTTPVTAAASPFVESLETTHQLAVNNSTTPQPIDDTDDFGSSSGEEEVLEVGTF